MFPIFFLVKGFFYVSLLLGILKEVTGSSLKQTPDSGEEVATLFDMVQKVFQKMLECMAWSFRKQPEEGLRVLTPSQSLNHAHPEGKDAWGCVTSHTGSASTCLCHWAVGWVAPPYGRRLPGVDLLQCVVQSERWCCLHWGRMARNPPLTLNLRTGFNKPR